MPGTQRIKYAIRLPANQVLQNRIGYLFKRPVGRPPNEVRRYYANFTYQAASWTKPRRVIAKVEWHPGELYPRVGLAQKRELSVCWHLATRRGSRSGRMLLRTTNLAFRIRSRKMQYRAAIDGLRAVAVLLVLLFHARIPFFSGGYVGVDVFFVISGYLITALIHQEHVAGGFTLLGFYERRIRRIFPALFLVMLSTFAIAAIVMLPPDLSRLGSSIVAATLFASNFYFWERGLSYLRDAPNSSPFCTLGRWQSKSNSTYSSQFSCF